MSPPELIYRFLGEMRDRRIKRAVIHGRYFPPIEKFVAVLSPKTMTFEEATQVFYRQLFEKSPFLWQATPQNQWRALFSTTFAHNRDRTLTAAENILNFRFKIFDTEIFFEDDINWHWDPLLKKSIPLTYSPKLDYYSGSVVKEVKYVWELNRHRHFVTLAKAYFLSGEEKYAEALFHQWSDWIDKNPYMMGINWTSSLECAFRLISWTWALQFARKSDHLKPGLYLKIIYSVHQHAVYINGHLSTYSSANNHLIGEAVGLIMAGCYFPSPRSWHERGFKLVFREILRQVHKDGVTREQTTYYQRYIWDFGILAKLAAEFIDLPFSNRVFERLEKMSEFYSAIINTAGDIPHIGDDDGGKTFSLTETYEQFYTDLLCTASLLWKRGEFKRTSRLSEETLWLLGYQSIDACNQLHAKPSEPGLTFFDRGGYAVIHLREPVERKLVFDCGPLGLGRMAAHGHADALSVTLSVDGEKVWVDSGTYMYLGAADQRRYFRSTRAHNTVEIDGKDQSVMLGPFQWGRRARCSVEKMETGDQYVLRARHDGYRFMRISHSRTVLFGKEIEIIDTISGIGNHQIDVYFHLGPCRVTQNEESVVCTFQRSRLECRFSTASDVLTCQNVLVEEAPVSYRFGELNQHPLIHIRVNQICPFELRSRFRIDV